MTSKSNFDPLVFAFRVLRHVVYVTPLDAPSRVLIWVLSAVLCPNRGLRYVQAPLPTMYGWNASSLASFMAFVEQHGFTDIDIIFDLFSHSFMLCNTLHAPYAVVSWCAC